MISLECAVDSEWNDAINFAASCSVAEIFIHKNYQKSSLQRPKRHTKYLNNRTCYDKLVCTILFSSRWWVYWYELLSALSTLQNCQNFDKTPNKGIFTNFGYFLTIWNTDIIRICSWLISLYHVRLLMHSFVEITNIQLSTAITQSEHTYRINKHSWPHTAVPQMSLQTFIDLPDYADTCVYAVLTTDHTHKCYNIPISTHALLTSCMIHAGSGS